MTRASSPAGEMAALSRRLRQLRTELWPDVTVTQRMLADALRVGVPSISTWESTTVAKVPTLARLDDYATFFATKRSVTGRSPGLLGSDQLTSAERHGRDKLARELYRLHAAATGESPPIESRVLPNFWQFPDGGPIRIICGLLPDEDLPQYASASNHNYMQLSAYADVDAMVELFGHIRALNPDSDVRFELAGNIGSDDMQAHLVLLGGIGLNPAARLIPEQFELPVHQVSTTEVADGEVFQVIGKPERQFHPTFVGKVLVEDVGLFARTPNPSNVSRTLTICNGVFTRGVYGAVRCLTDSAVSFANYEYLASRFGGAKNFGLLMRVPVFGHATSSPDLTNPATVLYEWPIK